MTGMIAQLLAWPTLSIALLVFGIAPGVVLRLIVLSYRRGDPRRKELLGELYAIPRIERPFWVAEQLELAVFEGLRDRLRAWHATRRNNKRPSPLNDLQAQLDTLKREQEWSIREHNTGSYRALQVTFSEPRSVDVVPRLLDDDVARRWRGHGWRGAQPKEPGEDNGTPAV